MQDYNEQKTEATCKLYAVDWIIGVWLAWRAVQALPLPKRSKNQLFYLMKTEELDDFLKFRDAFKMLRTPAEEDQVLLAPEGLLLYWLTQRNRGVRTTIKFEKKFVLLLQSELMEYASWILDKREEENPF